VLRLLRAEDLELLSRKLSVRAAELSAWRDAFLAAGEASLKTRPADQGVRACFGAFAAGGAGGLELRHDHGSQFVADDYQRELASLGIASSPAFLGSGS